MKGFKDTTRTVSGHRHVPASEFHTLGKRQSFAQGGPVMHPDPIHGLHEKGGVEDFHKYGPEHSAVLRETPSTDELKEHGGKTPLTSGYKKGGETHFHVHKHFHTGGKTKHSSKSYRKHEHEAEKHATGGTINKKAHGGSCETGGTRDKLHKGGFPKVKKGALHKDMGIPQGEKIPRGKIRSKLARDKAHHNVKGERRDLFALNMGKAKGGHIHDSTHEIAPDYATGGTINRKATGGTINKKSAGGALYHKGGESSHERSGEHIGFRSELSNLRRKVG